MKNWKTENNIQAPPQERKEEKKLKEKKKTTLELAVCVELIFNTVHKIVFSTNCSQFGKGAKTNVSEMLYDIKL